jgi:hypothetical protein
MTWRPARLNPTPKGTVAQARRVVENNEITARFSMFGGAVVRAETPVVYVEFALQIEIG